MNHFHTAIVSIPLGVAFFLLSGYLTANPMGPARREALQQYRSALNVHSNATAERTPWIYFGPPTLVQRGAMTHS